MKINILQLEEGAEKAEGVTVIIDVFRAFSLEAILLANGASEIVCCYQQEQARKLHDMHADWVLIGERDGEKLPGFDYGNSPSAVRQLSFAGKTVIHTTTNGTRGLAAAVKADILLAASLLNAKMTAGAQNTVFCIGGCDKISLFFQGRYAIAHGNACPP